MNLYNNLTGHEVTLLVTDYDLHMLALGFDRFKVTIIEQYKSRLIEHVVAEFCHYQNRLCVYDGAKQPDCFLGYIDI